MTQSALVTVPLNATPEMIAAAEQVDDLYRMGQPELWGRVYRAMIAAAPLGCHDDHRPTDGVTKRQAICDHFFKEDTDCVGYPARRCGECGQYE